MKIKSILILFCFLFTLTSLKGQTGIHHANDIATKLAILQSKGSIKQDEDFKEVIFHHFKDGYIKQFQNLGLGHRIEECISRWQVFKDKNYIIL